MLHPDYQYDPRLVTAMAAMVDATGRYDLPLAQQSLAEGADIVAFGKQRGKK